MSRLCVGGAWPESGDRSILHYKFFVGSLIFLDPNNSTQIYITTYGGGVWHGPDAGGPGGPDGPAAGTANQAETILTPVPVAQ